MSAYPSSECKNTVSERQVRMINLPEIDRQIPTKRACWQLTAQLELAPARSAAV